MIIFQVKRLMALMPLLFQEILMKFIPMKATLLNLVHENDYIYVSMKPVRIIILMVSPNGLSYHQS